MNFKKKEWEVTDSDGNTTKYSEEAVSATTGALIGASIGGPVGAAIGAGIFTVVTILLKDKKK